MSDPAVTYEGEHPTVQPAPVGSAGKKSSGWFGMLALIVTEASLFLYLQFSYYYLLVWHGRALLPAQAPSFKLSLPNTVVLILSSVAVWWAERGVKNGSRMKLVWGLIVAIVLGAAFIGVQVFEWKDKPFRWDTSSYGSLYFTITGFHMLHVAAGLIILLVLLLWGLLGYFDRARHAPLSIGIVYWHFVDVVWITVFFTFYITPYLGGL